MDYWLSTSNLAFSLSRLLETWLHINKCTFLAVLNPKMILVSHTIVRSHTEIPDNLPSVPHWFQFAKLQFRFITCIGLYRHHRHPVRSSVLGHSYYNHTALPAACPTPRMVFNDCILSYLTDLPQLSQPVPIVRHLCCLQLFCYRS